MVLESISDDESPAKHSVNDSPNKDVAAIEDAATGEGKKRKSKI